MNNENKTSVEIRNLMRINTQFFEKEKWQALYKELLSKTDEDFVAYKELGKVDTYYLTRKGGQELYKVKQGAASLPKIIRAVQTLEKYLKKSEAKKKRLKRQKLVLPHERE